MMEIIFNSLDNYLTIRKKFTEAWPNLRLEMHEQSVEFWKEGRDEFHDEMVFFQDKAENKVLLGLSGSTTKSVACRLLAECYSDRGIGRTTIQAFICGNVEHELTYPQDSDSLDDCCDPFMLHFNRPEYGDFKKRFRDRWQNLDIEVREELDSEAQISVTNLELSPEFDMSGFSRVNRLICLDTFERNGYRTVVRKNSNEAVLRDDVYISSLKSEVSGKGLSFEIRNLRHGIYWNNDLNQHRLIDFNNM